MIRSSKHILKYQTNCKTNWLDKVFKDYKEDLQFYIDLIWNGKLPLLKRLSTKDLPINIFKHSKWRATIYEQASAIIRSNKRKVKPDIKNISILLNCCMFDIKNGNNFDEFIRIKLPYFYKKKVKEFAITIKIPIKQHKHSLKFKDWKRKNTVQLKKINKNYYLIFFYEKEALKLKEIGKEIGIDQGYKRLLVTSDGELIGEGLEDLYKKISRKKQGSKNFKQALVERNNTINKLINKNIDLDKIKTIHIEDLKGVKQNTKKRIYKKFMNKLQRWNYPKVISKLERFCEENGVLLHKVNPAYTSQRCSNCGEVHKESRKGLDFECISCNMKLDADINAAKNILHRGVYSPSADGIILAMSFHISKVI